MNSLYGNIISHTPRSRFDISKVYPSRTEMEQIQSSSEGDSVPLFGYILIDYAEKPTIFDEEPPKEYYYSYNTLVAFRHAKSGEFHIIKNYWSSTTGKHLNWINPDKSIREDEKTFNNNYKRLFN